MEKLNELTLRELWKSTSSEHADLPAVSFVDEDPITFKEMDLQIKAISSWLKQQGIQKGDRVSILSENKPNWSIVFFAVTTMGATVVPILPDFHATEVETILKHSEAKYLFVSNKLYDTVQHLNGKLLPFISLDLLSPVPKGTDKSSLAQLEEAVLLKAEHESEFYAIEEDDLASLIYTSGTTGSSKGVMLSHKNITHNAIEAAKIPNIQPGMRMLSILPLAHSYEGTVGMVVPLCSGACVYYLSRPLATSILMPAMQKVKPHLMLSVPLLIEKIYFNGILPKFQKKAVTKALYGFAPSRKLLNRIAGKKLMKTFGGRLYFFGIGGAKLNEAVEQFLVEAKFPYAIGYGMTEVSPLIAGANAKLTRFRSTGPVLEGMSVKIDMSDDAVDEGEILVKGPSVMLGYYKAPALTAEVLEDDGWLHTGDLGYLDKDGYLYISGRKKSLILGPSGENIYPEAIESVLNQLEFVEESLVYQEEGRLVALIRLNKEAMNSQLDKVKKGAENAGDYVSEHLESIKAAVNKQVNRFSRISKLVEHEEEFEKTPTKKIKRYKYPQKDSKNEK